MSQAFVLGANYWPRRKAMYWWSQFDPGEVREEFSIMHELGMNVARIFLLWDDFQPDPGEVSAEALRNLATVCDLAAETHLSLQPTFFTGHMSGPNWAPRWLLGGEWPPSDWNRQVISQGKVTTKGYRNPFHDPIALEAERILLRSVVSYLAQHPAIWMWDLGNEPDLFAWPTSNEAGRAWVHEMVAIVHEIDSVHPVTLGLHYGSQRQRNGLAIDQVFAETDVAVMHSYPMYVDWAQHELDPDFVPYTCAVTAALSGKPVLMQEFGGCTAEPGRESFYWEWEAPGVKRRQFMASEEDFAEFIGQVLTNLHQSGTTGALLWCFADYAPELWDRPPCDTAKHERFFGLVRPDGSLKPHAQVVKNFAKTNPQVKPIPEWAQLDINASEFYADPYKMVKGQYPAYLEAAEKYQPAKMQSSQI